MQKYIILSIIVLFSFIVSPLNSYAHTSLESTSPSEGETVNYSPDVITFEFSSNIAQEGNKVSITDQDGNPVKVEAINVQGKSMLTQLKESLPSGSYTVTYEIVSEDSHIVEGNYSFEVKTDDAADPSQEDETGNKEKTGQDQGTPSDDTSNKQNNAASSSEGKDEVDGLSPMVIGLASVLVLAGIVLIVWLVRKRGKQ